MAQLISMKKLCDKFDARMEDGTILEYQNDGNYIKVVKYNNKHFTFTFNDCSVFGNSGMTIDTHRGFTWFPEKIYATNRMLSVLAPFIYEEDE